ncbi:MAG: acetyl-CoA carboxylase biotin carboxyl carrier protein subunit [Cyclobacteriaceae bacterium]
MKTKIIVNSNHELSLEEKQGKIILNDKNQDFDLKQLDSNRFSLKKTNKTYDIDFIKDQNGILEFRIDGVDVKAEVLDHQKQILQQLGIANLADESISEIKSPMPGTILEILCKSGDQVDKGEPLIILEAMKMENVIKSPSSGTISKICVDLGENVEKNQSLIVF